MIKNATRFLPLGAAGATIVTLGWAAPTHALAVFGNPISPVTTSSSSIINNNNQPNPQQKAVSFQTDGRDWTLDRVILSLSGLDSNDSPAIEIRENDTANGGQPGALRTVLTTDLTGLSGFTGNVGFTPTGGNVVLNANTTYWLFVGGNSYAWVENGTVADPFATPPVPYQPGPLPSAQNGSGWQYVAYKFTGNGFAGWGAGNSVNNAFRIDATEITPVPFAFSPIPGLIVSGIIGGVKRARSKSRQAKSTAEA